MESDNSISEVLPVEMGIDFSGQNGFMTQHFLDRPQISSTINEMGRK